MYNVNMKSFTAYNFTLYHNLNNGVYVFDNESGIGKTYLADVINILNMEGFNGLYVNGKYRTEKSVLDDLCDAENKTLVIVDSYDRYATDDITDRIREIGLHTIIMVDAKIHYEDISGYIVDVVRTDNTITLTY